MLLKSALYYAQKFGFSVIPINPESKKPLIKWQEHQTRKADAEQIRAWYDKWPNANIGLVTGEISGIVVLDVDEEIGYESLNTIIPDSLIMPTATTPKGGKHFYFKYPGKNVISKARFLPGIDSRGDGGYINAAPSVRSDGKYEWLEGLSVTKIALPELPEAATEAINGQKWTNAQSNGQSTDKNGQTMFTNGTRNEDIFHTAHLLMRGGAHQDEVKQILAKIVESCGYPATEAEATINSAIVRAEKKERNLQYEVREFVDISSGSFDLHSIYNSLNLKERKEKKNVSETLHKLCKEGEIERVGNKNGQYRKVDKTVEYIDFLDADDSEFKIDLPLGLNSYVKIQPKNIIVVAGSPNSGKTAFLLNILHANHVKHTINYCSSEMGPAEWKDRLSKFEEPREFWGTWRPQDRSENFADAIIPEAVNIIDFLELTEDFYLVGRHMRDIYNKLTTGIAIVALQKAPGASMGRGGVGSLEKPRLYLTMEGNKIQIVKGKNWRHAYQNPNGMEREFSLYNGCKFTPKAEWQIAEDKGASWKH